MVDIALHVDDRHAGVFRNIAQVFVALAPVAVPDGDAVSVGGEYLADLLWRISVRNLHLIRFQENSMATQARHSGLKRVARARRGKEEEHKERFVFQQARWQVKSPFHFEVEGELQHGLQFFSRPFLRTDKIMST